MCDNIDALLAEEGNDEGDYDIGAEDEDALLDDNLDDQNLVSSSNRNYHLLKGEEAEEELDHEPEEPEDVLDLSVDDLEAETGDLNEDESFNSTQEKEKRDTKFVTERTLTNISTEHNRTPNPYQGNRKPFKRPQHQNLHHQQFQHNSNNSNNRGRGRFITRGRGGGGGRNIRPQGNRGEPSKKVLINPHFTGNVPFNNSARLAWHNQSQNQPKPWIDNNQQYNQQNQQYQQQQQQHFNQQDNNMYHDIPFNQMNQQQMRNMPPNNNNFNQNQNQNFEFETPQIPHNQVIPQKPSVHQRLGNIVTPTPDFHPPQPPQQHTYQQPPSISPLMSNFPPNYPPNNQQPPLHLQQNNSVAMQPPPNNSNFPPPQYQQNYNSGNFNNPPQQQSYNNPPGNYNSQQQQGFNQSQQVPPVLQHNNAYYNQPPPVLLQPQQSGFNNYNQPPPPQQQQQQSVTMFNNNNAVGYNNNQQNPNVGYNQLVVDYQPPVVDLQLFPNQNYQHQLDFVPQQQEVVYHHENFATNNNNNNNNTNQLQLERTFDQSQKQNQNQNQRQQQSFNTGNNGSRGGNYRDGSHRSVVDSRDNRGGRPNNSQLVTSPNKRRFVSGDNRLGGNVMGNRKKRMSESGNLHEVPTVDSTTKSGPITVLVTNKPEIEEDEDMRLYRQKIEQQKRVREQILAQKEERRVQAARAMAAAKDFDTLLPPGELAKVAPSVTNNTNVKTVVANNRTVLVPAQQQQQQSTQQLKVGLQQSKVGLQQSKVGLQQSKVGLQQLKQVQQLKPGLQQLKQAQQLKQGQQQQQLKPKQGVQVMRKPMLQGTTNSNNAALQPTTVDPQEISSFLTNRKIFAKDQSLADTAMVVVSNLSAGTSAVKLRKLCQGVGDVVKLDLSPAERQATVQFKSVASAHAFFKKYQRFMLDLSMINVALKP